MHYCSADLISAGATEEDMAMFADRERDQAERWQAFKPFLSAIRTGGYARSALEFITGRAGIRESERRYLCRHLKLARGNIAMVLADKIEEVVISRSEARTLARRLMSDNAGEFYGI